MDRPAPSPRLAALPTEVLRRVASTLSAPDCRSLASTCRHLAAALAEEQWRGRLRLGDPARAASIHIARRGGMARAQPTDLHCEPFPRLGARDATPAEHALIARMQGAATIELVTLPSGAALAGLAAHIRVLRRVLKLPPGLRVPLFPRLESLILTPTFYADLQDDYARNTAPRMCPVEVHDLLAALIVSSGVRNLCVQPVDAYGGQRGTAAARDVQRGATWDAQMAIMQAAELMGQTWRDTRRADGDDVVRGVDDEWLSDMMRAALPASTSHMSIEPHLVNAAASRFPSAAHVKQWLAALDGPVTFTAHAIQAETALQPPPGVDATLGFAPLPPHPWDTLGKPNAMAARDWVRAGQFPDSMRRFNAELRHILIGVACKTRYIGLPPRDMSSMAERVLAPPSGPIVGMETYVSCFCAASRAPTDWQRTIEFVTPRMMPTVGGCQACGRDAWDRPGLVRVAESEPMVEYYKHVGRMLTRSVAAPVYLAAVCLSLIVIALAIWLEPMT